MSQTQSLQEQNLILKSRSPTLVYVSPEYLPSYQKERLESRLKLCGSTLRLTHSCGMCGLTIGEPKETIASCGVRFCRRCASTRYSRALSRLHDSGIKNKRLIHAILGFPSKPEYKRHDKLIYEKTMKLFFKKLKAAGMDFKGFRVFDYNDKKNPYIHFHAGLKPIRYDLKKISKIRQEVIDELGLPFIFRIVPGIYRSRNTLFRYFAKRMAGLYGDTGKHLYARKKGSSRPYPVYYGFMLPDVMGLAQFSRELYDMRALATISYKAPKGKAPKGKAPKGLLSCNIVPDYSEILLECPDCHSNYIRTSFKIVKEYSETPDVPPPPSNSSNPRSPEASGA
jgi:hypothetical protein